MEEISLDTPSQEDISAYQEISAPISELSLAPKITQDPYQKLFHSDEIILGISNPVQIEGKLTKTTFYQIFGEDINGKINVQRNLSDFIKIRQTLMKKWPGCFVPPLPNSKLIGGNEEQTVKQRLRHLQYFCLRISLRKYLYYSQEFQSFLRNKQVESDSIFKDDPTHITILNTFNAQFQDKLQKIKPDNELSISRLSQLKIQVKGLVSQLKQSKKTAKAVVRTQSAFYKKLEVLVGTSLPQYEETQISEGFNEIKVNTLFRSQNQYDQIQVDPFIGVIRSEQNSSPFIYFYDMVAHSKRECEGIIEAIDNAEVWIKRLRQVEQKLNEKKDEISKINNGQQTLSGLLSSLGDTKKQIHLLEVKVQAFQAEQKILAKVVSYTCWMIFETEIPIYKSESQPVYKEILETFTSINNGNLLKMNEFWQQIVNYQNIFL